MTTSPSLAPRVAGRGRNLARRKALRSRSLRGLRVSRAVVNWTLTAWVVRFVAAIVIHFYSVATGHGGFYPLGVSDDGGYWDASRGIYESGVNTFGANIYPWVLAQFYHLIGGPDLLMGQLLNVLAGALTVGVGVALVQELTRGRAAPDVRRRAAQWTGALLTFYPSLLWYSTQLLKDPILILLGMTALYCQVRFLKRAHLLPIAVWVLAILGLVFFRPYTVIALVLALGLFVLRFNRKWFVPVVLFMALAPYSRGMGYFGADYIAPMIATERISQVRQQAYAIGGSSVGITVDYSNPVSFLTTFSYSFATAMFGPFPWQIKAAAQAVALPEAIVMWFLFSMWLRSIWNLISRKQLGDQNAARDATLLLFCLVLIALVALFSDNIGANTRLRLLPWSAFFVFASIRLARRKWRLI